MREILFRGKSVNTGAWAHGSLLVDESGVCYIGTIIRKTQNTVMLGQGGGKTQAKFKGVGLVEIDPKTIGQFTGFVDVNGVKIFEGDIIKFDDMGIYPVWWDADEKAFGSCWFSDFDQLFRYNGVKMEVIGNIHDHPELLEQEE